MDSKTDFVFYRDEKNNVFSGGYRINNMFKDLDIPVVQQKGGSSLVIPMGLFYAKNDIPINKFQRPENYVRDHRQLTGKPCFFPLLRLRKMRRAKWPRKKHTE